MEFPTQAERAVKQWQVERHQHTVAFETVALRWNADKMVMREPGKPKTIEWCFTDDSRVTITGMGASHKIEAHLP